jgi:branched-chain amino acid transport system ATP-binding protein
MPHRAAAGLARSFQISQVFPEPDVEDNVAMAVQAHAGPIQRLARCRRDAAARACRGRSRESGFTAPQCG